MAELVDTLPARVLGVYAHPDDPEISCGGTLARWAKEGSEVHVLICTRGEKGSPDPKQDPDKLAAVRTEEMAAAAEVLGLAGHRSLDNGDGELENTAELRGHIVEVIRAVKPDVVVCPDPTAVFFGNSYYNHHDHRATGWATLDAVAPAAGECAAARGRSGRAPLRARRWPACTCASTGSCTPRKRRAGTRRTG